MSEYEKELEARLAMYKKKREMERKGPRPVKKAEDAAYSRRFNAYMKRMRKKRAKALREFNNE